MISRCLAPSPLTRGFAPRYIVPMPIQFILPKKFTRDQIECRMDELSIQFQRNPDKKIAAQIAALNRLLSKMSERGHEPKNRQ